MATGREVRYRSIAADLRTRIAANELGRGRLLPSEAELSSAYAASRVTVRRALEELRGEGLVESRQGSGWSVAADSLRQSLGRLSTIEAQLGAAGLSSGRRILDFGFVAASKRVRAVLGGGDTVLRVRRLTLADGHPFARVTVWVPEDLGAAMSRASVERSTFAELLPVTLGGATQTIGAAAASEADARLLEVPIGSPVLRCERVTSSADGRPVLFAEHVFPAHRTEFVVDLPVAGESIAPTGLRLVE